MFVETQCRGWITTLRTDKRDIARYNTCASVSIIIINSGTVENVYDSRSTALSFDEYYPLSSAASPFSQVGGRQTEWGRPEDEQACYQENVSLPGGLQWEGVDFKWRSIQNMDQVDI
jgi:hypothetical protein